LVEITESAGIAADIGTSDRASRAGVEVDGAAGRIIAEHRREGPAEDVDRAVGVRVRQIGARQTVRLGHRKSVFEHLEVADAEAVTTTAGKPITPPFEGGKEGGICASWAAARVEAKHTNTTSATYPLAADCGMSKRSFPLTSVKKQPTGAEKISAPDSGEVGV